MESFTKAGDSGAYHDKNGLWIEQYLSADGLCNGMGLEMQAVYPWNDTAKIVMAGESSQPVHWHFPDWAMDEVSVY